MHNFCVPADFKKDTVDWIAELNESSNGRKVTEIYGSLNPSLLTSSRHNENLYNINLEQLNDYIAYLNQKRISFNYTLNGKCYSGFELSQKGRVEIIDFIKELYWIGVRNIIIANPYLIDLIKNSFPGMKITASVILRIDSIMKSDFYKNLGVNRIVLWEDANRDFTLIEDILEKTNLELEILVNSGCMFGCPMRDYHYNSISHNNTANNKNEWILYNCGPVRINNPAEIVKGRGLIRPSDISYYDYENVYFKIVGRTNPTEQIRSNIFSYLTGNDKLFSENLKNTLYYKILNFDITKLNGLMEFFKSKKNRCSRHCIDCRFCDKYVEKCFDIDENKLSNYLDETKKRVRDYLNYSAYIEFEDIYNTSFFRCR